MAVAYDTVFGTINISSGAACRGPDVTVAQHWGGETLALGLDRPLLLSGGKALLSGSLALGLGLDWAPTFQDKILETCSAGAIAQEPWFSMSPCIIAGYDGVGRTHMARSLARHAGVPFVKINVAGAAGAEQMGSTARAPDIGQPSAIATALSVSRSANPVVLVEGIDHATDEVIELVQAMVDPTSSPRWNESSIGAVVDLSHVTWLIQCSTKMAVPRRLAHLQCVEVEMDDDSRQLRALSIMAEVLHDFGVDPRQVLHRGGALMQPLYACGFKAAADLRKVAENSVIAMADI